MHKSERERSELQKDKSGVFTGMRFTHLLGTYAWDARVPVLADLLIGSGYPYATIDTCKLL